MPPEIVDLNDYQVTDWPTTLAGEERQARETIQHYKTLFAHPLVEGITWWDSSDGGWLNAPAGLIRKDGSIKPAYEELIKLIKGEWWVPPTQMVTNEQGQIQLDCFFGEYKLTYGTQQETFRVTKEELPVIQVKV
jgi:hypothetical protein